MDQDRPVDGTEVTYALYRLPNQEAAARLVKEEEVDLLYLE